MGQARFVLLFASVAACGNGNAGQTGGGPDAGQAQMYNWQDGATTSNNPDAAGQPSNVPDATSGQNSNPFVGQWSCPYTTNSGYMASTKMVFMENADGTLSSSSMIQTDACMLKWTVSGSTATALSPQTCGGFTVNSYRFKLEPEPGVAFTVATATEHGTNVQPDGSTSAVDISGSFGGFCTKDGGSDAGTPTLCEQDPVAGCGANGVGYLCLGALSPPSDSGVTCPQLFTGGSSCCTLGPAASTCHADPAVSCTGTRTGYTCTGTDTPAQAASIVCEPGKAQGSKTTYCCGPYTSPSCSLSGGCGDYTFSCTGSAYPWQADKSLRCGPPNAGFGGTNVFCCSVRDPAAPNTCTPDSTLPCAPTMGYSCTGTDTPSDDDPSLNCGSPTTYQGKSLYCCMML